MYKFTQLKKTSNPSSCWSNLNKLVKSIIGFAVVILFLLPANSLQAQIVPEIDGNPQEWDDDNIIDLPAFQYQLDPFGNGVVDDQFTTGSKDFMELGNSANQFIVWTLDRQKQKTI